MDRPERIALAIKRSGKKNKDIAEACGVSPGAVSQWVSGLTKNIRPEALAKLAYATSTRMEWIATGEGPMELSIYDLSRTLPLLVSEDKKAWENVESTNPGIRHVPVIGYVQAGLWTEATDPYPMGSGSETISSTENLGPTAFALRIKGDSNYPEYKEGEIVIIDPSVTPMPGDMVVAKNGEDEATFKKYRPRGTDDSGRDVFELVPLNSDYPTLRSDKDGPMRIIGTMVEHRRFRKR
jgi:SOS-response transcriptional repressor LexA